MPESKYRAVADESGQWSVVDAASELPAVLDGVPQVGLSQEEAESIADTLNAMTDDESF
jgi:hypothetical protein